MCVGYWKHETYWVPSQIHLVSKNEFHPPTVALPLTVEDSRRCVCQTRDFTAVKMVLRIHQHCGEVNDTERPASNNNKKIEQEEEEEGHQTKNCCFLQCWFLILNCGWSQCLQFHQKSPFTACFCTFWAKIHRIFKTASTRHKTHRSTPRDA